MAISPFNIPNKKQATSIISNYNKSQANKKKSKQQSVVYKNNTTSNTLREDILKTNNKPMGAQVTGMDLINYYEANKGNTPTVFAGDLGYNTNNYNPNGNTGGGGNGGGGASASVTTTPVEKKEPELPTFDWQKMDIDEMAKILGLETYKQADILELYNKASNKKFDELDTQVKRTRADNLRTLQGQYDTYLNNLRESRANAVANGITKGSSAALQLAAMYANAQSISENQQAINDTLYDLGQQRATALAENETTAMKDRQAIEQYLGSLRGTYRANDVNELAARLAADSQVQAAKIQADATTKAAGINAAATQNAATAAQDKVYNYYVKQYGPDLGNELYLRQVEAGSILDAYNAAGNLSNLGNVNAANDLMKRMGLSTVFYDK